jgi:hypothetical protein
VTEDQKQGYAPTPIENLQPDDVVLVDLPVEATVELVSGTRMIVSDGSTTHVIYMSKPWLWKKVVG